MELCNRKTKQNKKTLTKIQFQQVFFFFNLVNIIMSRCKSNSHIYRLLKFYLQRQSSREEQNTEMVRMTHEMRGRQRESPERWEVWRLI